MQYINGRSVGTVLLLGLSSFIFSLSAQYAVGQTGGTFDLSHNVIASGGGASSGTNGIQTFSVEGTIGQGLAGTTSTSALGPFSVRGGFWAFRTFVVTAASVSVSGQVTAAKRLALSGANVVLTDSAGATRTAITDALGYYNFADVPVGETYLVTVSYAKYKFAPRALVVDDEISGLNFVAEVVRKR